MNLKTTTLALALAVASGGAFAQSAKFAASHNSSPIVASGDLLDMLDPNNWEPGISTAMATCLAEYGDLGEVEDLTELQGTIEECSDVKSGPAAVANMATIHVSQSKELLVGLSAEVGLFTETEVKGKRGSVSTATAAAGGYVGLKACPTTGGQCVDSIPTMVTLNSRMLELEATLGGVLESCDVVLVDTDEDGIPDEGEFDATMCDFTMEEIRVAISTIGSHHYNFVFVDLDQGPNKMEATFYTEAQVEASASCGDSADNISIVDGDPVMDASYESCLFEAQTAIVASGEATAKAVIGNSMMTVQEVRMVRGSDIVM